MDVQCERCKTEYEFDDALISARGTTVRCTHCGHQFKVRRPTEGGPAAPEAERWAVRTARGEDLVFLTLRELQKAILAKQVSRSDVLTHGRAPPRALGTIGELDPFFEGRSSSSRPPAAGGVATPVPIPPPPRAPTDPGVGAGASFPKRVLSVAPKTVPGGAHAPQAAPPAVRPRIDTLRPPAHATAAAPPPPVEPFALTPTAAPVVPVAAAPVVAVARGPYQDEPPPSLEPPTLQRPQRPPVIETSSPLPPPTVPQRRPMSSSIDEDAMADAMRRERLSYSDADPPYGVPRRRRIGGWIVALVLLSSVGGVGYFVVKQQLGKSASATTAALDPKALQFLSDGEKALSDGNLDAAKEDFDKASVLAEKDPRVLLDLARLSAARADVDWLRMQLLPKDAPDRADTQTRLADEVERAKKTADDALSVAPDDPSAVRAKIDALRIGGDREPARALVGKVIANATQPETAYVLAALDIAEPDPSWPTAIQRLRLAAQGEANAGRARAMLVYALARSGDKEAARSELAKLTAASRPHPLASLLATFVDRAKTRPDAGPVASGATPTVDVSSLPKGTLANDGRSPMQQAIAAIQSGDSGRARAIYQAMLANNPNDSQALCGLGDVARASGDTAGAISYYKQTLAVNPNYLPAMIGLADVYYGSGNRGAAVALYKQISDNYPDGSYPAYVKERAGAGAPPPPAATATDTAPTATATTSATAAPSAAPTPTPTPAPTPTPTPTPAPTPPPASTNQL